MKGTDQETSKGFYVNEAGLPIVTLTRFLKNGIMYYTPLNEVYGQAAYLKILGIEGEKAEAYVLEPSGWWRVEVLWDEVPQEWATLPFVEVDGKKRTKEQTSFAAHRWMLLSKDMRVLCSGERMIVAHGYCILEPGKGGQG
jgi:hypothetical protein